MVDRHAQRLDDAGWSARQQVKARATLMLMLSTFEEADRAPSSTIPLSPNQFSPMSPISLWEFQSPAKLSSVHISSSRNGFHDCPSKWPKNVLICNHHAFPSDSNTQFPSIQCKWPLHLLFCKYHAFPTARFRPIQHPSRRPTPPREKKLSATFGDIWGHMSHFHAKIARTSVPL